MLQPPPQQHSSKLSCSSSSMDMAATASAALHIVRNADGRATKKRYSRALDMYAALLSENGVDPSALDRTPTRCMRKDPVTLAAALILARCGPQANSFEGLGALTTGGAVKSAVVSFWNSHGECGAYQEVNKSFVGNPGKAPQLQALIHKLDAAQKIDRSHGPQRAYQQTHEDVRALFYSFILPSLPGAFHCGPLVDYKALQCAALNVMQFATVSRVAEMLQLHIEDLHFTGVTDDAPVVGVLPNTKTRRDAMTYFRFEKGVDLSVCGLNALLAWLCVLRAHGITSGPLFVMTVSNRLQGGVAMDAKTYATTLRELGRAIGVPGDLAEDSARRGGAGYNYFMLRRDILYIYRAFSWDDMNEMLQCVGIEDAVNSYALLGFTAFGTSELRWSMLEQ